MVADASFAILFREGSAKLGWTWKSNISSLSLEVELTILLIFNYFVKIITNSERFSNLGLIKWRPIYYLYNRRWGPQVFKGQRSSLIAGWAMEGQIHSRFFSLIGFASDAYVLLGPIKNRQILELSCSLVNPSPSSWRFICKCSASSRTMIFCLSK